MFYRTFSFFLLLSTLISSMALAESRAILSSEYENFAWGHTNHGCYLNEAREVYVWHILADTEPPTKIREITREELQEIRRLLLEAEKGEISAPRHRRADYGKIVYKGYIHEDADRTREVLLGQDGDWVIENSSPAAETLIAVVQDICSKE